MLRYIVKRLLMMIPVVLGISFIIFAIVSFAPGDPATLILGENADPALIEAKREELGLNDNFVVRYIDYIGDALTGDFGESYKSGLPVTEEIAQRLPHTMIIAIGGILLSVLIGVPLGMISAIKQYSVIDYGARIIAMLLTAIPVFWLGLIMLLYFSLELGWVSTTGVESWRNYVLPIIALAASATATQTRITRSSMLESVRQDYVRTARAKGVLENKIMFKHVLRNSILPVITIAGMNIGVQMGSTVVIESVFGITGMGNLLINAVRIKDAPLLVSSVVLIALIIGIMNLLVDLLYTVVDPRLKSQYFRVKKKPQRLKDQQASANT